MAYNTPEERFNFYKNSRLAVDFDNPVSAGLFDEKQKEKLLALQNILREAEDINDVLRLSKDLGQDLGDWVEKDVLKNFGELGPEKELKLS